MNAFSFARLIALLQKESIQILRDAMTLRIIIAIPIMQLFLFGFAINSDPKHLPAGLLSIENSKYERTIAARQLRLLHASSAARRTPMRGSRAAI
jgi:ABC-2 type transport system permease protein